MLAIIITYNDLNEAQGQPAPENPPRLIPVASILLLWLQFIFDCVNTTFNNNISEFEES